VEKLPTHASKAVAALFEGSPNFTRVFEKLWYQGGRESKTHSLFGFREGGNEKVAPCPPSGVDHLREKSVE